MVFFSLRKLDKGEKDKPEKLERGGKLHEAQENIEEAEADAGAPLLGAAQDKEKDKSEKKKKGKQQQQQPLQSQTSPSPVQLQPVNHHKDSEGAVEGRTAAAPAHKQGAVGVSVNDFISKTKTRGLKPSGPELIAYARYLGIDPVADHDLLWIAIEALEAPLPCDWTEHFDRNDRVFYYNASTRASSWIHPLEHIYRETYKSIVSFRNANMTQQEKNEKLNAMQQEVIQMEHDVHKEIAQWTEHTDEDGNRFYFNREERQSTWTDPRPAKCQVLWLRTKMLRLLMSTSGCTNAPDSSRGEVGSRFAPIRSDGDDLGLKRPKAGAGRGEVGASEDGRRQGETVSRGGMRGALEADPGNTSLEEGSDTDSDESTRRKKKKKKKKRRGQNEVESAAAATAAPPPRPNTQGQMQRAPDAAARDGSLGGKLLHSVGDEARGGAFGGLQQQQSSSGVAQASRAVAATTFDHQTEGLSNVGRARVKAGIRLEPIRNAEGSGDEGPQAIAALGPGGGLGLRQPLV